MLLLLHDVVAAGYKSTSEGARSLSVLRSVTSKFLGSYATATWRRDLYSVKCCYFAIARGGRLSIKSAQGKEGYRYAKSSSRKLSRAWKERLSADAL